MADERFDLMFRGDIVLGQPLAEVKQRLQQLFKVDAAKIDSLFSGRPVALKRQLDRATAQKYQAVLHKAGAQVTLTPSGAAKTAPARSATEPRQPQGLSLAPAGGLLLKPNERARLRPVEVDVSGLSLRPAGADLLDGDERSSATPALEEVPNFDLAPVGSDMGQRPSPQAPAPPDTSALSLVTPSSS